MVMPYLRTPTLRGRFCLAAALSSLAACGSEHTPTPSDQAGLSGAAGAPGAAGAAGSASTACSASMAGGAGGTVPGVGGMLAGNGGNTAGTAGGALGGAGLPATGGTQAGTAGAAVGGAGQGGGGGGSSSGGSANGGHLRCPAGPFATPTVTASKNVCAGFSFAYSWNEGPTWVAAAGAFFFSNFVAGSASGGNIVKYTPGGNCEVFINDVGCNGLGVSNDGNLLAACQQNRAIVKFDVKTKQMSVLADKLGSAMLDTPNDLIQHSNGTIYFTNPPNELAGRPQGVGPSVLRIDPSGNTIKIADGSFNGIALSPDEKTLYVIRTDAWTLDAQGVPSNKRAMVSNAGDGMAVDCAGNLYIEGKIFAPDNQQVGTWGSGTNLAFGGVDGKTVLVAGPGKALRELALNVPGLP